MIYQYSRTLSIYLIFKSYNNDSITLCTYPLYGHTYEYIQNNIKQNEKEQK